ncbi:hypothetical protein KUTeg_016658 [Tegillarca granosa]|uniref:Uncharacterized protein n=1 Tax=Tegillarca granosa TaxID=220873 RepID=A0ABQ9ELI7_TEGGR|nr:hypothetical protein KUTeg_016658 [Tegillarca granosa]
MVQIIDLTEAARNCMGTETQPQTKSYLVHVYALLYSYFRSALFKCKFIPFRMLSKRPTIFPSNALLSTSAFGLSGVSTDPLPELPVSETRSLFSSPGSEQVLTWGMIGCSSILVPEGWPKETSFTKSLYNIKKIIMLPGSPVTLYKSPITINKNSIPSVLKTLWGKREWHYRILLYSSVKEFNIQLWVLQEILHINNKDKYTTILYFLQKRNHKFHFEEKPVILYKLQVKTSLNVKYLFNNNIFQLAVKVFYSVDLSPVKCLLIKIGTPIKKCRLYTEIAKSVTDSCNIIWHSSLYKSSKNCSLLAGVFLPYM